MGGVLSKVLEENGENSGRGKWGLGGVLSNVLEENGGGRMKIGGKWGLGVYRVRCSRKMGANGGLGGCTEYGARGKWGQMGVAGCIE